MIHDKRLRVGAVAALVASSLAVAYVAGSARAGGIPQTNPLTYSGVLLDAAGNPAVGSVNLDVAFFDQQTGGSQQCTTSAPGTALVGGRFQVTLDAACAQAVHDDPDLFVEVRVAGLPITAQRPRLGAVPYALEAGVAQKAVYRNPGGIPGANASTVGGGFCAVTANAYNGAQVNRYSGAKNLCQTACASPTAHMCSADELARFMGTGGSGGPAGTQSWFAGALYMTTSSIPTTDCVGWTNATNTVGGPSWAWDVVGGSPTNDYCSAARTIACCD